MESNQVYKNIQIIEKYLVHLDTFTFESFEEFESEFNDYLAISMSLFTILNACIEIGESIIDLKRLEFPQSYRYIFTILQKNSILSKELAQSLSSCMRERNMIAHQYDEIDTKAIYELYRNREIFNKFLLEIKPYF